MDERLRQAILAKKQAQINDWSQQIEDFEQALQSMTPELRVDTDQRVLELSNARD